MQENRLLASMAAGDIPRLLFVGQLKDGRAVTHPVPQFEIHDIEQALPAILQLIVARFGKSDF